MSSTRFRRYLGLPDPRAAVETHLRPLMPVLRDWAVAFHPAAAQFWAVTRAQAALNELAQAISGEPLYRPAEPHTRGLPGPRTGE